MLKYINYSLIRPNKIQEEQITSLICNRNGSVFHEIQLNKIIESTFKTKLRYFVDNPDDIKDAAVVHITKNKIGLKRYNISPLFDIPYSGFIGQSNIDVKDFSLGFFNSVNYVGFPYTKKLLNVDNCNYGETTMVDLRLSEDDIFNTVIHSKRRNMIRKAIKENITIKSYFNLEGLEVFWPILEGLHNKLGYSHLTFDYYKAIFQRFSLTKQAFILIAFKNNDPISGVFILGNSNFMHYYKGASIYGVKNEGQGELLQWEAIKQSKDLGSINYDLCNLDKERLPEVYRFKTGISKSIFQYQKLSYNSLGYKIVNRVSKIL